MVVKLTLYCCETQGLSRGTCTVGASKIKSYGGLSSGDETRATGSGTALLLKLAGLWWVQLFLADNVVCLSAA